MLLLPFFDAAALLILLVLLAHLRKDAPLAYFRIWLAGWTCLTAGSLAQGLSLLLPDTPAIVRLTAEFGSVIGALLFLAAVIQYTSDSSRKTWQLLPLLVLTMSVFLYIERGAAAEIGRLRWETGLLESVVLLFAGMLMWRKENATAGVGSKLLAAALLLGGLHGLDRPIWPDHPLFLFRVAFDDLVMMASGIGMVIVVLEGARARTEELSDKLRRLTLLTTASTQTLSVQEVLDNVLHHLVVSMNASGGVVRILEGEGDAAELVVRSSIGFDDAYLQKYRSFSASTAWAKSILHENFVLHDVDETADEPTRRRLIDCGMLRMATVPLPGKNGPLGIMAIGSNRPVRFQEEEIAFMANVANLLGLTLQNVTLFKQAAAAQQQWADTFDSIADPVFVHDPGFRIGRSNRRLAQLVGREDGGLAGALVREVFSRKNAKFSECPYCEGVAGDGDERDPWLPGYFLASNSSFADSAGRPQGTIHVLKDITERKRAEEKYQTLVSNVQEGVFISTPQGHFLDFNQAFLDVTGYASREELLSADILSLYVDPAERDRLKKLLQEHGSVNDFEFEVRRKDGEIRTVIESSIAVRDGGGSVTAYQGFLQDITERKRAEMEIRRRNRDLMVLNSISQTLNESLNLRDSVHRALAQLQDLFHVDSSTLYLLQGQPAVLRRIAALGHRSEYANNSPQILIPPEVLQQLNSARPTFVPIQALPFAGVFRELQQKEGFVSVHVLVLWSKDKVIGGLSLNNRTLRDYSPADINLLVAIGSQLASAAEKSMLYEETRLAYDNLRRTQEQLLHSEKMAAVGQLISGVAHELNNPLTAILGYSQLLTSSTESGTQTLAYSEKLYKQAQRTHRIVQNLLSFARQHKPERNPVQLNQTIEDTLALRDYDLRSSNIRLHLDLAPHLPLTSADPHQMQQVFLNMVNNALDAILEHATEGDIWIRTAAEGGHVVIEIADSGPGVKDPLRVFDPFYTTKPVGKGTGLGLSICYGIVTEHGGAIRVHNDPPRGAKFLIELPLHAGKNAEVAAPPPPAPISREGRILIVDRDESVLEAVSEILRSRYSSVMTAQNAEGAQEILGKNEFDVLVADLRLGDRRNGGGFFEWLEAQQPVMGKRLVLMSSAAPLDGNSSQWERQGVQILQKPFKTTELIAAVEEILRQVYAAPAVS